MSVKEIAGYKVYFGTTLLEGIDLGKYNRVKKTDEEIAEYRENLYNFFHDVLMNEGVDKEKIGQKLEVHLTIVERDENVAEAAIRLFHTLEDKRLSVIAKMLGITPQRVSSILRDYFDIRKHDRENR